MAAPVYEKEYTRQIKFKLNRKFDADVIEWLEQQENVQGYLKELVRADIALHKYLNEEPPKKGE